MQAGCSILFLHALQSVVLFLLAFPSIPAKEVDCCCAGMCGPCAWVRCELGVAGV